jgi:threonine/homoserine/homoserine lactone efflux protein
LITIFASSFVIALSGAMMPGTLLTVTISESSKRGVLAGPLLILGHGILEMILLAALFMGMAPLFKKEWFFFFISIAGGSILLWMAAGMFRSLISAFEYHGYHTLYQPQKTRAADNHVKLSPWHHLTLPVFFLPGQS